VSEAWQGKGLAKLMLTKLECRCGCRWRSPVHRLHLCHKRKDAIART
jgi:hypothetical protein